MTGLAYPPATSAATALERWFFVAVLVFPSALPVLVGTQVDALASAEEMGLASDQGNLATQVVLALLYAGCAALLLWRARLPMLQKLGWPLLLLLLWCAISALWSDMPSMALRRAAALAGTVTAGLYAGLRFDVDEMVELLCRAAGIVVLASLALGAFAPSLGLDPEGRLRGVFSHKNSLGAFAALGLLALAAALVRRPRPRHMMRYWLTAAGCVLCLVLARSASPLPVIGLALALLFWVRFSDAARHWQVGMVLAAMCAAGFALPLLVDDLGGLATVFGRDPDFSGRSLVWDFGLEIVVRNPWLGAGYGIAWNGPIGALFLQLAGFPSYNAHNGYLQLALDVGSIGLALFLCLLAVQVVRAVRLLDDGERSRMAWPVAFMGFCLLSNLVEASMWTGNELLTTLLVYVVVRTNVLSGSHEYPPTARRAGSGVPFRDVPC
jgi:exopolysaccharide production protein ExoQ